MPSIAEIRAQFPQYDDLPDAQLVEGLRKTYYADMDPADFAKRAGLAPAPTGRSGIMASLSAGTDMLQGSLYSATEGVGAATGIASLQDFGRRGRVRNEEEARQALPEGDRQSFADANSIGDYGRAAVQALGTSLPSSIPGLAGGAAGAMIGGAILPGVGAIPGALIGSALGSFPGLAGSNRQAQIDANKAAGTPDLPVREGAAFGAAVPQAVLEGASDALTLRIGRVLGLGGEEVGRKLLPRIARGIGLNAAGEVPTEVLQTALERAQAGQDVLGADAMAAYKEAAISAAVVGGALGGASAGIGGQRPETPGLAQDQADRQLLTALQALRVPGALEAASEEDIRASARAAMMPDWQRADTDTLREKLGRLRDQIEANPSTAPEDLRAMAATMERDDRNQVRADETETDARRRVARLLVGQRAESMDLAALRRVTKANTPDDMMTTGPAPSTAEAAALAASRGEPTQRAAREAEAKERAALVSGIRNLRGASITQARLDAMSIEDLRRMAGVTSAPPTTPSTTPPTTPPPVAPETTPETTPTTTPPPTVPPTTPPPTTPGPNQVTISDADLEDMLAKIKAAEAAQASIPKGARMAEGVAGFDPATIGVDADTFQFKAGGDEEGVTDRLQGVKKWDPTKAGNVLIYEYADGRRFIADGHQRLGLAKRLQADGATGITLNGSLLREADGYSPADARAIAAAKNISEGTGSALDAAKVIRDLGEESEIIKSLPPASAMVRDAKGLARLSPQAFSMVVNDLVPATYAAQVGRYVKDPDRQSEVLAEMHRNPPSNALEAELMVKQVSAMLNETEFATSQGGLFDDSNGGTKSWLIAERAKVLANAIAAIRADKKLFATAIRGSTALTEAGNKLDNAANQSFKNRGEMLLAQIEANANTRGPVSDALNAAAKAYAENKTPRTLGQSRDAFLRDATKALAQDTNTTQTQVDTSTSEATRIEDPNQGGFFSSREPGANARDPAGTTTPNGRALTPTQTKAKAVVEERLAKLRKQGKQGVKAAEAVEAAMASGMFSPKQIVAAFRIAETAAQILGPRELSLSFLPRILAGGRERQGQLQALSPDGLTGMMLFSLSPSSLAYAPETAAHEAFHVAQALYSASDPKIIETLREAFPAGRGLAGIDATIRRKLQTLRPYGKSGSYWDALMSDPNIRDEPTSIEMQAYVFGALDDARRQGASIGGIKPSLLRFANFFSQLRNRLGSALKGDGFRTAADVLDEVSGGGTAGLRQAADLNQPFSTRDAWGPKATSSRSSMTEASSSAAGSPTMTGTSAALSRPSSQAPTSTSSASTSTPSPSGVLGPSQSGQKAFQFSTAVRQNDFFEKPDQAPVAWRPETVTSLAGLDAKIHGPVSEDFVKRIERGLSDFPKEIRDYLKADGASVQVTRIMADYDPALAAKKVAAYKGATWDTSGGVFVWHKRHIVIVERPMGRDGNRTQETPEAGYWTARHEAAHALDWAIGMQATQIKHQAISVIDQRFKDEADADSWQLNWDDTNRLYYYVGGSGQTRDGGYKEVFAEAITRTLYGNAEGKADIDNHTTRFGPQHAAYAAFSDVLRWSPRAVKEAQALVERMVKAAVKPATPPTTPMKTNAKGQGLLFSSRSAPDSPAFKAWFGSSKVVEKNGSPRVVYHGTNMDFEVFASDKSKINRVTPGGEDTPGMYFTGSETTAANYASMTRRKTGEGQPRVMPAYLRLTNPLDITNAIKRLRKAGMSFGDAKREALKGLDRAKHDGIMFKGDGVNPAEFVVFEPSQVKSPRNNGDFDPTNPSILFSSRARPEDLAGDTAAAKAFAAVRGPAETAPAWYKGILEPLVGAHKGEGLKSAFYRNVINRAAPGFVLDEMLKADGRPSSQSIGQMIDMSLQNTGRIEMVLEHGPLVYDAKTQEISVKEGVPSVLDALMGPDRKNSRVKDSEREDFQTYLAMLRERDLMRRGRKGFKNLKGGEVANAITAYEARRPAWKDAAADFTKLNNEIIKWGVDTGILEPGKARELAGIFYTPFYRAAEAGALSETGAGGVTGPSSGNSLNNPEAFEKTVNEGGQLGDLFENMIRNYDFILRSGMKNLALNASAEGMASITNKAGEPLATKIGYRKPGDKQVVEMKKAGVSVYYQLNPNDQTAAAMFVALTGLPQPVRGGLFSAAAKLAGVFRTGVTSLPSYMIANLWRGKIVAYAQEGLPFHTNTVDGVRQVYRASESVKKFAASTGFGGFAFGMGDRNQADVLGRKLRTGSGEKSLIDGLKNAMDHLQKASESTELADRIKLMEGLIAKGMTPRAAAYQAYLLAPYSRRGAGGGLAGATMATLTPLVPFLNSKIQSIARMFEAAPGKKRILGLPADAFLRGLVLTGFSVAAYGLASEDERWEEETAERKLQNDIIYTPAGRVYLPRAFEYGTLFGAIPVFMLDAMRSKTGTENLHKGVVMSFLSTLGFNPIPQAVLPLLEVATNFDFFRNQPLETRGMEALPVDERRGAGTSTVARGLSGAISAVDEAILPQGSRLEISPVKAQKLIEGYTGSMGTMLLAAIDGFLGATGAIPERPAGVFGSPSSVGGMTGLVSGLGRFIRSDQDFTSRFVQDFYQTKEIADQLAKSLNDAAAVGDRERVEEILKEGRTMLGLRSGLEASERSLSLLNRQMRVVGESTTLGSDEKRDRLTELRLQRNEIAKRTVEAVRRAKETTP